MSNLWVSFNHRLNLRLRWRDPFGAFHQLQASQYASSWASSRVGKLWSTSWTAPTPRPENSPSRDQAPSWFLRRLPGRERWTQVGGNSRARRRRRGTRRNRRSSWSGSTLRCCLLRERSEWSWRLNEPGCLSLTHSHQQRSIAPQS